MRQAERSDAHLRGLARPSALEWLQDLSRVVGPQPALLAWSEAADATALHGLALDLSELERLGTWLSDHAAALPVRAAARSCLARLRAYRVLDARSLR